MTARELHLATTRIHWDRILAATDFSAGAEKALLVAAGYARRFNAELLVVTAQAPLIYAPLPGEGDSGWAAAEVAVAALENAERRLAGLDARPEFQGIRHRHLASPGLATEVISATAEESKADLIVVGLRSGSGFLDAVIGSTAQAVMRHAPCPVLVVGPNAAAESECGRILLATDLGPASLRPAQYACALAEEVEGRLTLLHVAPAPAGNLDPEVRVDVEAAIQAQLRQLLPVDSDLWCAPATRVAYGQPSARILEAARELEVELIVMGVRAEGLLAGHAGWSTLAHVLHDAPCPVLVVRHHLT